MKSFTLPTLGKKIAFSTFVQLGGKVIQLVISAVTLKLISNYLTEADYGFYASVAEFALFLSVAANLGIFGQTVRAMSENPRGEKGGKIFFNALVLRVVTALLFLGGGLLYLMIGDTDPVFLVATTLFAGALFFDYVTSVCDGMLQANYMMGRATVALVLGRACSLFGVFAVTRWLAPSAAITNIPLLFMASLGGAVVAAGLSLFFVRQQVRWKWALDRDFMLNILKLSLPFGVINILNSLYFRFLPEYFSYELLSNAAFATFNISFKIAQVLSLFSTFLMFSVLPGFKQYLENQNWKKAKILYKRVWMLLALGAFLLVTLGSLFGPWVLEMLTHKKYFIPEFWYLLPTMLLLAGISYGYDLILITLFAFEKDFWLIKREFVALSIAVLFIVGAFAVPDLHSQIALFLVGAVLAESFMVVNGVLKIRSLFKEKV